MQVVVLIIGVVTLSAAILIVLGMRPPKSPTPPPEGLIQPERTLVAPDQQTPATVRPLLEGEVDEQDVLITLVDLAARGFLTISALTDDRGRTYDWLLQRTDKRVDASVRLFEEPLLTTALTPDRTSITLGAISGLTNQPLDASETKLGDHLRRQGWFTAETSKRHSPWGWIGALILLLGLLLTVFQLIEWLASNDFRGLIGGALMLIAGVLLASRGRRPVQKTDSGERARDQMTEFAETIDELTAADLNPAELPALFNRLLPWTIAFGTHAEFAAKIDGVAQRAAGWGRPIALRTDWISAGQPSNGHRNADQSASELAAAANDFVEKGAGRSAPSRLNLRGRMRVKAG